MKNVLAEIASHHKDIREQYPLKSLILCLNLDAYEANHLWRNQTLLQVIRWFQVQSHTRILVYGREVEFAKRWEKFSRASRRVRFNCGSAIVCPVQDSFSPDRLSEMVPEVDAKVFAWFTTAGESPNHQIFPDVRIWDLANLPRKSSAKIQSLVPLIREMDLPATVQTCWHGINDQTNLHHFLESSVRWGEVDIRRDKGSGELITRHDSYEQSPKVSGEKSLNLEVALESFSKANRGVKVDFKQGRPVLEETIYLLHRYGFTAEQVWFHSDLMVLHPSGFKRLSDEFPGALIQTTIDRTAYYIRHVPLLTRFYLRYLVSLGINRFLLSMRVRKIPQILNRMEEWGYQVNLYQIPDLNGFLRAMLWLPNGIVTDYNFPEWDYFGRGSGQDLKWHVYPER